MIEERFQWWLSLKHGGLLIAPSRLVDYFSEVPKPIPDYLSSQLRRDLTRLQTGGIDAERTFLDTVLEQVCGLTHRWEKGNQVDSRWSYRALTGEIIKPRRVWYGQFGACLPVFVFDETRLGIGRGRRAVSRTVEWLRQNNQKLAVLTNHKQFRLIHAGLDYEAFAEWDTELWFEEGMPGPQITALQVLLSPQSLTPPGLQLPSPLLEAIQASRRGQAELSAELGERVRQAVELIIQTHGPTLERLSSGISPRDIYLAATRVVMRMVILLFAEARDLLPRDNPIYHNSYGLQGLRELLDRVGGGTAIERLRHRYGAWPRILALFRLVYEGSHHQVLPVRRYGGDLFATGDPNSTNPVSRALSVFEDSSHNNSPSDAVVQIVLGMLCRATVKVRQGRSSSWVEAPVDFSDLSSEYIGILYEGLLDYELRQAKPNQPIVFLDLGDEPALPLDRLEAMDDHSLPALVEKFKIKKQLAVVSDDETDEDSETDVVDEGEDVAVEAEEEVDKPVHIDSSGLGNLGDDSHQEVRNRARSWARRAVIVGKLVKKPRSKKAEDLRTYEETVEQTAKTLVKRVILPGKWFLVRWGGTRKGSGTFYTRPQLAVPTVQRTLLPLSHVPPKDLNGKPDEEAHSSKWTPKLPEEILRLKVCDPSMGSGSFLVASLRFLTEALYSSLHQHGRIQSKGDQSLVTLAGGKPSEGKLEEELLPCRPEDSDFEMRLRARLKRYVVERCIYGVDIDPLAVELARLALWIETMDKDLPFEFLDHKLRVGNALVGCWFDYFRDYPALAWDREGGDKNHSTGVHFQKEAWTKTIKTFKNKNIKGELVSWINRQGSLLDEIEGRTPDALHDEAMAVLKQMHSLPVHETEERSLYYHNKIATNPALIRLKEAFDTWCAIWFWPPDQLDKVPTPRTFEDPPEASREIVAKLAQEYRFFHWEIEFPDVFATSNSGFDSVVGNPPWENLQANPAEYFSNLDPLFRAYGRLETLNIMTNLFNTGKDIERDWLLYCSHFKAYGNWVRNAAFPFGDDAIAGNAFKFGKSSSAIHSAWRTRRLNHQPYGDIRHPYRSQHGGRIFTYKLFLELSHALLRVGGQLGMLAPSAVYTDKGSAGLRTLFLTNCRWRWLFGIINWNKIFESIYYRFKFCIIIVEKGGSTSEILSAFSRYNINEWEEAPHIVLPYLRTQIEHFSPKTHAILEVRDRRDLDILEKIYTNSVLLGDEGQEGWGIRYTLEFMMNTDAKLFPPRPQWEGKGYKPDKYGRWIGPDGDIALPLYEGRMIGQFDFSQKGWVSGKGRSAVWREIPWADKIFEPQYLMSYDNYIGSEVNEDKSKVLRGLKIGFMAIGSATNARSMVASHVLDKPCGNSVPVIKVTNGFDGGLALLANLNSYSYDFALRARLGGLNLNYFVIEESPVVPLNIMLSILPLMLKFASLAWPHPLYAAEWIRIKRELLHKGFEWTTAWKHTWAITDHERLRLRCMADAIIAELYGFDRDDLFWILRSCDYSVQQMRDRGLYRTMDPKGFWRVDKDKDPELRHTVLTLAAFHDLKNIIASNQGNRNAGMETFCTQNGGDGWMLPETLCLADLGLGHDDRAKEPQPVRERLGERFLPWQRQQSVEDSWNECELHAKKMLGEEGFAQLQAELAGESVTIQPKVIPSSENIQTSLFSESLNKNSHVNQNSSKRKKR